MEESAPDLRLLEPASPEALLPAAGFPWWPVAIATALVIALVLWLIFRKSRGTTAGDPSKARREAFQQARTALQAIHASQAREAAIQASLILRTFLAKAVEDPALYETHEEFITKKDSLTRLSAPAREAGEKGFFQLARLKYSPEVHGDPQTVIKDADELLETLHQGLPA